MVYVCTVLYQQASTYSRVGGVQKRIECHYLHPFYYSTCIRIWTWSRLGLNWKMRLNTSATTIRETPGTDIQDVDMNHCLRGVRMPADSSSASVTSLQFMIDPNETWAQDRFITRLIRSSFCLDVIFPNKFSRLFFPLKKTTTTKSTPNKNKTKQVIQFKPPRPCPGSY